MIKIRGKYLIASLSRFYISQRNITMFIWLNYKVRSKESNERCYDKYDLNFHPLSFAWLKQRTSYPNRLSRI